jgi:endonuclease/exonuclease/phosphatase family metal-dependent hydrolase
VNRQTASRDANSQTVSDQSVSRRGVLRGVAGGLFVGSLNSTNDGARPRDGASVVRRVSVGTEGPLQADGDTLGEDDSTTDTRTGADGSAVTVMTWNLYVGADLRQLLARRGDSDETIGTAVARLLTDIEESRFDARAAAIADHVAAVRPDLVGLQEVTLLRLQLPGDYVADPGRTNAAEHHLDFLALLQEKLRERGLEYDAVSSVSNTDIELPGDLDAGSVDVRLTDRDVILARRDLETRNATRRTYEATLTVPLPDGVEFPLTRGYCSVDVAVGGTEFTFVNTHLDSVSASTQLDQARELIVDLTALDRPVVLVGDFNSPADGSETVTYDLLTQFFTDAYAETRAGNPGYTCCRDPRLTSAEQALSKRLDLVLLRDVGAVTAADRVGIDPDDRVSAVVDGEFRRLWPSDHAGVVATVRLGVEEDPPERRTQRAAGADRPTEAEAASGSASASSATETERSVETGGSTEVAAPGFGAVTALVAFGALAAGLLRRRER